MFKIIKIGFYVAIVVVVVFLWWFIPKYSFIKKNPGYCAKITEHLYYCGTDTNLDEFFK